MDIIVTKEHWDKALVEAPPELDRSKYGVGQYTCKCLVAQALTDAGFDVAGVSHHAFRTMDGGRGKLEGAAVLVCAFDRAESDVRAGREPVVPELPVTIKAVM